MSSRRYSGYLADDESMRGPQMRNPSPKRKVSEWRNALRQPSPHPFWNPEMTSSRSTTPSFGSEHRRRHKPRPSTSSAGESRILADEFSEFVDFLADENVLDSLQRIMEDAVRKLRDVTLEDGQRLFNVQEDSRSSAESEPWSFSYSSTRSRSRYPTTSTTLTDSTSSSEEDLFAAAAAKQPKTRKAEEDKVCLLDKYASRLPKLDSKKVDHVSGRFHAETFSERSGDDYFYRQEHLHIWAKLAESFEKFQPPKKDYFSKFKREPQESGSAESLQKEITNVLKRPMGIPTYSPDQQPFLALDFLEEHKILSALQDIINQAVQKVLQATGTDGVPLLNLFDDEGRPVTFWDSSIGGTEDEEEEEEGEEGERSGSGGSGSGEDTSDDLSDGSKSGDGKKKRKKKGKKKKKKKAETSPVDEKGKPKYAPPPLPKFRRKSFTPEETQRKPKYVPPPLPKTKPRPPPGTPPPKPKYVPPPLPKPKLKKKESVQMEAEPAKQALLTKHIITPKDVKRARLQARPIPKQSVINFLIENAAKLVLYKYNYEALLCSKLGLISVPVTKVLLEIMFGYKRMKGSGIRLSSQIDWAKVYDEIYAPRPPKPKMPRRKPGDSKKGRAVKGKGKAPLKGGGAKKAVFFQPEMAGGKVVVMGTPTEQELSSWEIELEESATEEEYEDEGPEIFEIVPPHFLGEGETDFSADEADEDSLIQPSFSVLGTSTPKDSPLRSAASEDGSFKISSAAEESEGSSLAISPKKSGSRKLSVAPGSTRGSQALFPEVEPAGPSSAERVRRMSSRRSTLGGEGSKTVFPKI